MSQPNGSTEAVYWQFKARGLQLDMSGGRPAVCKFYKQGHCSYGNNCRFYHPPQSGFGNNSGNYNNNNNNNNNYNYNNGYNNYNNRGRNNNNYGNAYNNNGGNTSGNNPPTLETPQQFCDPRSIGRRETEIRNDMNELQDMLSASNHIFTSYSLKPPVKINILPQRDFSYEEDRLRYYVARNSNSIPQYQQQITNRRKDMMDSINFLRSNTQRAVRYLQLSVQNPNSSPKPLIPPSNLDSPANSTTSGGIFGTLSSSSNSNSVPNNPFNRQVNPFGGGLENNPTSSFGTSTASGGAFGNQSLNSSPFASLQTSATNNNANINSATGNTSSPFGQSGFGNKTTGAFGSYGFGSTSATNPFGASPFSSSSTSNPFGASVPPAGSGSAAPTSSPGFGSSNFGKSGFGNSPFGANSTSTPSVPGISSQQNPFGSGVSNSNSAPFGTGSFMSSKSPFGNITSSNTTGGVLNNNNVFQSIPNPSPFGGTGGSTFGSTFAGGQQVGFKQSDIGEEQTKLEDIKSEGILAFFKNDSFKLGMVPDIPPPIELC